MMAWKCTTARRCISAALPNDKPDRAHPPAAGLAVRVVGGPGNVGEARLPRGLSDVPVDGDGGAPPQFPGHHVPDGLRVVVVAVQAQWRTEVAIRVGVPGEADQPDPVRADGQVAAGVARLGSAVAPGAPRTGVPLDDPGVDLSERRRG